MFACGEVFGKSKNALRQFDAANYILQLSEINLRCKYGIDSGIVGQGVAFVHTVDNEYLGGRGVHSVHFHS